MSETEQAPPCDGEPRIEHMPGRILRTTCPKCGEVGTYPDTTSGAIA